jgi:DNA-binding response OmpR family regulator
MNRLLVIEDDQTIGAVLDSGLRANGYLVTWRRTGAEGLAEARRTEADLVLLDLGLPDLDGIDVCRDLRTILPHAVIVILTARREEIDVVSGLESGADDYLTKPFSVVEVLARVRAHLRRSKAPRVGSETSETISMGSLTVDTLARRATVGTLEVSLRAREFDLLTRLIRDAGSAVRREVLMNDVWDENWFGSTKTLDVHIASLRRKLAAAASAAGPESVSTLPTISTLRGHGYRIELEGGRAGAPPRGID